MKKKINFRPLIKNPYMHTFVANYLDFATEPPSKAHFVKLPDGDVLSLEVSTPQGWTEDKGTVAMIHGLCGSSKSSYIKRLSKRVYDSGRQAIRINMRGCGIGKGLARHVYHSGCSGDIEKVLNDIKKHFPSTSIVLVGYSLGGNVTIKLSGELGRKGSSLLSGAIAVSPPVNLLNSARLLALPKNARFGEYFAKLMYNYIDGMHKVFPDLPPHNLSPKVSVNDIDEFYIARRVNYSNAIDYYKHCSSKPFVKDIKIPINILFAVDDPIVNAHELDEIDLPDHVKIHKTDHGGHIGFVGMNILREFRWMDNLVEEWIENIFQNT